MEHSINNLKNDFMYMKAREMKHRDTNGMAVFVNLINRIDQPKSLLDDFFFSYHFGKLGSGTNLLLEELLQVKETHLKCLNKWELWDPSS